MNKIKRLSEADYHEIFPLSQFAFQYKLSEVELEKKQEEAKRHIIWGWMENEQLAAKLHLIPLSCYMNGKTFEIGGISSVATWPEYRRQGAVKHLLHHALQHMKENGQTISFLHPFAFSFYRKYGWELTFVEKNYTLPMESLKGKWGGNGYVRRIQDDIEVLHDIYTSYAKKLNGMLVRDKKWWKQRVLKDNYHIVVAYNDQKEADGYVIYKVKENKFVVEEMVYASSNGQKLLLQFIANHDSMAEKVELTVPENDNLHLLIDEPRFAQEIVPYFMARIVDVFNFLKNYPFLNSEGKPVVLHIEDSFLPENSGTYQLTQAGLETKVTTLKATNESGITCTIQTLTSIFLGYKRPIELYDIGFLQGGKKDIEQLEQLIPEQQTFLSDFF
ncbi:enhanced intracellular survival protein Eis [Virgibacillus byunsanensis]|uniref:Enhanced intracellular survival protein Eis n=1 Tax=Virgibacillus byunsanensis TaxID=570945 RepID=A0ABW3LLA3_9BACI